MKKLSILLLLSAALQTSTTHTTWKSFFSTAKKYTQATATFTAISGISALYTLVLLNQPYIENVIPYKDQKEFLGFSLLLSIPPALHAATTPNKKEAIKQYCLKALLSCIAIEGLMHATTYKAIEEMRVNTKNASWLERSLTIDTVNTQLQTLLETDIKKFKTGLGMLVFTILSYDF